MCTRAAMGNRDFLEESQQMSRKRPARLLSLEQGFTHEIKRLIGLLLCYNVRQLYPEISRTIATRRIFEYY